MIVFYTDTTANENEYCPRLTTEGYKIFNSNSGSFNIICARLLGFSYPDYLRFVRDNYNASLRGRQGYTYSYFKNKQDCEKVVRLLNESFWNIEKYLKER